MTKKALTALLLLVLVGVVGLAVACGGELPDDSVAKVGDTYITEKQYENRVTIFEHQYQVPDKESDPEAYQAFRLEVLDYLVTYEIASQKAESLGAAVTDEELQTEIDALIESSYDGNQATLEEELSSREMTLDDFKRDYKERMLLQKVYEVVSKDVTTVPDDEVAAYYEAHKSDYYVDEIRAARHILISPGIENSDASTTSTTAAATTTTTGEPTEADWTEAKAIADKVRADLAGGADWTAEAAQYSDDPGTKDIGGELGTFGKGQMVPEFDESVFSLAKDEISQPIKTTYGYHVIQVTEITPAKQYTLEEVKEDVSANLLNVKKLEAWQAWVTSMKTELQVVYRPGMEIVTTTTTTAAPASGDSTTTSVSGETTTTTAASPTTAGSTTTTAKP